MKISEFGKDKNMRYTLIEFDETELYSVDEEKIKNEVIEKYNIQAPVYMVYVGNDTYKLVWWEK